MATTPNPVGGQPGQNPLLSTVLGALQNRTNNPGQDYAQQSADLQGADPKMLLDQLDKINKLLGVMFVQTFQRLPNVANQISQTMKQLSRAIKEGQQAASVSEVVKPPINQSLVNAGGGQSPSTQSQDGA